MLPQRIPVWANATSYPAGGNPWSGLGTNVAPAYAFFTPGVPIAAQEENYLANARTSATAANYDMAGLWRAVGGARFTRLGGWVVGGDGDGRRQTRRALRAGRPV